MLPTYLRRLAGYREHRPPARGTDFKTKTAVFSRFRQAQRSETLAENMLWLRAAPSEDCQWGLDGVGEGGEGGRGS
jgi:hypothetical protein